MPSYPQPPNRSSLPTGRITQPEAVAHVVGRRGVTGAGLMSDSSTGLLGLEVVVDGEREGVRAEEAADELYRELQKYLPDALPGKEAAGEKGIPVDLATIIVQIVTSGAMTELIKCLRGWVKRRPSSRKVVIRDSRSKEWTVTGENVDDATIIAAIKAAVSLSAD